MGGQQMTCQKWISSRRQLYQYLLLKCRPRSFFFFASFCLTSEIPFLSVLPLLSYVKFVETILFLKWPGLKAVRLRRLESPFQVPEKVYRRTDGNAAVHVFFVKRWSGLKALGISPCVCVYYLGNWCVALKITKKMFWVIYSRCIYYSWKENIK